MLMVCLHLSRSNPKAQAAAGTWWRYMPERAKERTVQVPAAVPHIVLEFWRMHVNSVNLHPAR